MTKPDARDFVDELARHLTTGLVDIVPPRAMLHLLKAQREMLLAVTSTIEHHRNRAPQPDSEPAPRRARSGSSSTRQRSSTGSSTGRSSRGSKSSPARPRKIPID